MHLPCGHGLGDQTLESKLLLLKFLGGGVLNLELGHGVTESRLNALLVAALELHGHARVGDNLLDTGDVRLELLARLEALGEGLVAGLELGSIYIKVTLAYSQKEIESTEKTYRQPSGQSRRWKACQQRWRW
jgi:hypothetical protein